MDNFKLPVIEMFGEPGAYAVQGEGLLAGVPSVFIRTFGCNLRCKFGLTDDPMLANSYVNQIRNFVKHFPNKKLEELPVYDKFCDTYYSLFPEFRKYVVDYTVNDIVDQIEQRTNLEEKIHLVITGGEPLLPKYQTFWAHVFNVLDERLSNHFYVTFETNGTYELITDYSCYDFVRVNFSVSPKLRNSGHSPFDTIKSNAIQSYFSNSWDMWFKFVVKDELTIKEINSVLEIYNLEDVPVYLMPEGGTKNEFDNNQKTVYNLCCKYGFRYSPRHQVSIMGNGIGI